MGLVPAGVPNVTIKACKPYGRALSPLMVPALALLMGLAVADPAAANSKSGRDCFREIEKGRGAEIVCEFPTRLTEDERRDLARITRDVLVDASCVVSIRIGRSEIDVALAAADSVFEAPPQPVRCELVTREQVIAVTGTFAPRVSFAGGRAVAATPGLAQVEGISPLLAWPVVHYVNRSPGIQDGMIQAINAYRSHRGLAREAQRR